MGRPAPTDSHGQVSFVSFSLGDALLAIDILEVREINKIMTRTRVPMAPDYVKGVINLRGQIVTIIDLAHKLQIAPAATGEHHHRNIIVDFQGEQVGLFVDAVHDVIETSREQVEQTPANVHGINKLFFRGVLTTPDALFAVLDLEQVLAEKEVLK